MRLRYRRGSRSASGDFNLFLLFVSYREQSPARSVASPYLTPEMPAFRQQEYRNAPSPQAIRFRAMIADPDRFLESCDGGDPGTPDKPALWLLGLEPGWSVRDVRREAADDDISHDEIKRYSVNVQLESPYNRNAFKLLAALKGESPENYAEFARRERPFEQGSSGYLKVNLFPVPCNNLDTWSPEDQSGTGFVDKEAYRQWIRATRFPILREWLNRCRPKLVICTGLTCMSDFMDATGISETPQAYIFEVNGHPKRIHVATDALVPVAFLPHLSGGPNGLNSDEAISKAADYIRASLNRSGPDSSQLAA